MIKILSGKHQRRIAWLLFFIFYGELAASVHAAARQASEGNTIRTFGLRVSNAYAAPLLFNGNDIRVVPDNIVLNTDIDNDSIRRNRRNRNTAPEKTFIGGPGQPEMSSFKSVGADNMVNLFTGDFSYSIPLIEVGSYPINLFYNAGITMDQEASWVGLGWNINPGTISRNMRGLPDDYNGIDTVTKQQSVKPDLTIGVSGSKSKEVVGNPFSSTLSAGIFYNNRRGLGLEVGLKGEMSMHKLLNKMSKDEKTKKDTVNDDVKISGGIDLNSQEGMSFNAGFEIQRVTNENVVLRGVSTSIDYNSRQGLADIRIEGEYKWNEKQKNALGFLGRQFLSRSSNPITFARSSFTPSIRMPVTRFNQMYSVKFGKSDKIVFKNIVISGYVQESKIHKADKTVKKPAYGYMYYEKSNEDQNALMDFNRINDRVYTYKTPVISVPVYTYDVFSISGEGTGGSFRGYRGNMGYVRDHNTSSRTGSVSVSVDFGAGKGIHAGVTLGGVYTPSFVEEWQLNNRLRYNAAFKETQGIYQGFYFKNPGEKAIIDEDYYHQLGEDKLIRPYLDGTFTAVPTLASGFQVFDKERNLAGVLPVNTESYRHNRDKRAQVITYLTAKEADLVGLNKTIYSYTENVFRPGSCTDLSVRTPIKRYNPGDPTFYRKAHHISAVNVLESDGRTYVYDVPAYQIKQKEVSFSVEGTPANQLIAYGSDDNTINNSKGRDGFFQSETLEGYAHSYLLSGILSPDYVDVTGDGITDDDLGTAVKFNYSRVNKQSYSVLGQTHNYWYPYRWRMPADTSKANYNEGLKADAKDDKGLYTYGEKELWYLHSLESKNMVATFHISNRDDGKSVSGDNGGVSGSSQRQKKLDRIDVYTKADYLKYGSNARPITTVHFAYSYKLCKGFNLNSTSISDATGKLTLDSIWFSYNGNQRQKKNKYIFKYSSVNPNYSPTENDRWGTYKAYTQNPSDMPNSDYPYTIQDTTYSNPYSSAWCLSQVLLPSGGIIMVQYEADDYAYVQNKRASQMTAIAGFGPDSTSTPTNKLYTRLAPLSFKDHRFVFFDVSAPIADREELAAKYMQDFKQLLLKLWVLMPAGNIGMDPAYEPVTVYSTIQSFGLVPTEGGFNHYRFYVELEPTAKGTSPIMQTVLQFLKDYLPHRAYPGREVKDDGAFIQVVRSVWGLVSAFVEGMTGFSTKMRAEGKCKSVELNYSFARLNNPLLKKLGGGHRVKTVIVGDNWKKMTARGEVGLPDSYYGQEYNYTTVEEINGEDTVISSGVASYEPGVGNEENPFREILKYQERQFLGPTEHSNIEMPVAETFFPSPVVGYSKVSVRSIHNKESKSNQNIRSGIGLQQTEFYTTRDFPVITDFTSFDPDSRHHHKPSFINKVFKFNQKDYLTLTQGFRVILNDMNGKIKSQASYPETDLKNPINYTGYHYRIIQYGDNKYKLDNVLPVIGTPDGKITHKLIGTEIEIMNDFREHFSYTRAGNIPLNVDFFTAGGFPIILPSIFRMAFRDESRFRSASTLKLVNEYGILDSVVNIDKGSVVSTKNLIYDAENGDVLVSRTNNEFDKAVYQFNYPAWWVNTGMEPAYRNVDLTYKNVVFRNGKIEESPQVNMDYFESGDEVFVMDMATRGPTESFACTLAGYPKYLPMSNEYKVWALDRRKDVRNSEKDFIFIDRNGVPYNAANATIRIIRSGKRNLAATSVGNVVSLKSPVRIRSGSQCIIIDDTTDVINSGAVEFKEKWRATDQFYSRDTTIVTVRRSPLQTVLLTPTQVYSAEIGRSYDHYYTFSYKRLINRVYEISKRRRYEPKPDGCIILKNKLVLCDLHKATYDQSSWLRFDLESHPSLEGSKIVSGILKLEPHNYIHQPHRFRIGLHDRNQPHVSTNQYYHPFADRMKFSRMLTPWYDTASDASWQGIFFDAERDDRVNNYTTFSPPSNPMGRWDVDVTRIAQGMIDNYGSGSVASGIKFSYWNGSRGIPWDNKRNDNLWRYCFNAGDTDPKGLTGKAVKLELNYYKCSPTDSLLYEGGLTGDTTVAPPPGYIHCRTSVTSKFCFSVFTKAIANPYIEGILTAWRPFRSYVYYGERRESDPNVETDIRKDGIIKEFEPYWDFDLPQLAKTGSPKWVWNSEITQYNRKGAELENHDPLDRYNAGLYGYQESLPIAVVNNSRLRLSAFDGFEDYYYKDDPCEPYCKPSKRHFDAGVSTSMLDSTQAHTGRYSVKVNANTTHQIEVPVSADDPVYTPDLRIGYDSIMQLSATEVRPKGNGLLRGTYYENKTFTPPSATVIQMDPPWLLYHPNTCHDANGMPPGVNCNNVSVEWEGRIQVAVSGTYEFTIIDVDDWAQVVKDDTVAAVDGVGGGPPVITPVTLIAGEYHSIKFRFVQDGKKAKAIMWWKPPGATAFGPIPNANLYPEGSYTTLGAGSIISTDTVYCVKPDTIQAISHHLIDSFNLVPGKKIVASVWMKKGGEDCKCTGYPSNFVVRNASNSVIATFQPKERIIEGWQQFEAIFTVPEDNKVKLDFAAPVDALIYIDDLRLHPFNANMKSFVYDPVTLRLAAELDENNFAAFYEYDDEGTLVRVKKETRLGIKTIKETRSSLQKSVTGF